MTTFWKATPDGVMLMIKVQPKSRRPGVQGTAPSAQGPRLKLGVTEAAEGGRANAAVVSLLSGVLRVPAAGITIVAGQSSREKLVRVAAPIADLEPRLASL